MLNSVIIPILFILDHTTRISENSRNMPADRKKRRGRPPKETSPESNPTQNVTAEEETRRINFETLTRDDLDCPICIDLVNEPVRLKCDHLLCRECFERLLELSARKCPKCRRWIGGTRRIADWLDSRLWQFIRKKFHSQYQTMDEQIKSDRKLALSIARQQRRESYFRRSHYVLRSSGVVSRMDTSISTISSSTVSMELDEEDGLSP